MRREAGVVLLVLLGHAGTAWAEERAIVAPTGGDGIEEPLLPILTGALRTEVASRGWTVLSEDETDPVVQRAATAPTPSVDGLRRLARAANAHLAAHVGLRAATQGRVWVRVRAVTREAPGSWEASEQVASGDVIPAVRRLAARTIPPAAAASGSPAAGAQPPVVSPTPGPPIVSPTPGEPPVASPTPDEPPIVSPGPTGEPPIASPGAEGATTETPTAAVGVEADVAPAPRRRQLRYHLWIGPMLEGAIGTNREYYNQLVGARATYLLARPFGFNAVATYAYYSDEPGFGLAFWGGVEGRIGLSSRRRTSVPIRFGLGYAPMNGPLVKVEGGFLVPVSPKTDLVFTLLSPTIWFLEGGNAISMDLGIELSFAAG